MCVRPSKATVPTEKDTFWWNMLEKSRFFGAEGHGSYRKIFFLWNMWENDIFWAEGHGSYRERFLVEYFEEIDIFGAEGHGSYKGKKDGIIYEMGFSHGSY